MTRLPGRVRRPVVGRAAATPALPAEPASATQAVARPAAGYPRRGTPRVRRRPRADGESEQRLTYAVDLTFDGPSGPPRRYRNLPKLSMLPNTSHPVLVYLGVSGGGNGAVFLVDSTLTAQGGEAACRPSATDCATVTIEPGEQQFFTDERDRRYFVRVDQIRERPVGSAPPARTRRRARAAAPSRRFLPPLISDVLVRRVQR